MVALVMNEHLRLVLQPAERIGMDNAVAVALERRPERILVLGVNPAPRRGRIGGIAGPPAFAVPEEMKRQLRHAPSPRLRPRPD